MNLYKLFSSLIKKFEVVKEFLNIPTTPEYIQNLLKIKIIKKIFFILTVVLLLYSVKDICFPFFFLILKTLNINLDTLNVLNKSYADNITFNIGDKLYNFIKFLLKIITPFKCIFCIKIILNNNMFKTNNNIKGIIFRILYGFRLFL